MNELRKKIEALRDGKPPWSTTYEGACNDILTILPEEPEFKPGDEVLIFGDDEGIFIAEWDDGYICYNNELESHPINWYCKGHIKPLPKQLIVDEVTMMRNLMEYGHTCNEQGVWEHSDQDRYGHSAGLFSHCNKPPQEGYHYEPWMITEEG